MIRAGAGRHLDVFRQADAVPSARCTSSRVTWGGGDCLDDDGELVRSCPRHAPATYAQLDARHAQRELTPRTTRRYFLDRWTKGVQHA